MAQTITVKILGDAKELGRASREAKAHVEGIGSSVGKIGGLVAGAFSVGSILDFGKKSVEAAPNLMREAREKTSLIMVTKVGRYFVLGPLDLTIRKGTLRTGEARSSQGERDTVQKMRQTSILIAPAPSRAWKMEKVKQK